MLTPEIKIVLRKPQPGAYLKKTPDWEYVCELWWTGEPLDRPHTSSMIVTDKKIALLYQKAVVEGKFFKNPGIVLDVKGQTYVAHDGYAIAKYIKSDLKKLGYL